MTLKITTLIENHPDEEKKFCYEHGLSLLIEADGKRILFDTGQTGDFIKNAAAMQENLENLDYVVMSHGHYDHSGGFKKFVNESNRMPLVFVGEEFFFPKCKKISETEYKSNGNSFDEKWLSEHKIHVKKVNEELLSLSEHIMVFHHFHQTNEFEKRNEKFFRIENGSYRPDDFRDEISLGILTPKGLVVVVGCSHIGIVNILHTISERVNEREGCDRNRGKKIPIYAVIGGTHLVEADEKRLQKTLEALKELDIQMLAVSHCTGEEGIRYIRQEWKGEFVYNNTGNHIVIE